MSNTRLRFSTADDLVLLRQMVAVNPYNNPEDWKFVHDQVTQAAKKDYTLRALKDHVELLLKLFQKQDKSNIKKSGTEEEYAEKHQLLQEISDMKREFRNNLKKPNNQLIRNKGIQQRHTATEAILVPAGHHERVQEDVNMDTGENVILLEYDEPAPLVSDIPANLICTPRGGTPDVVDDTSSLDEPEHEAGRATPTVLGPIRRRQQRRTAKYPMLDFLRERRDAELRVRDRELEIEERKLKLEEAKLEMEKRDREEKRKLDTEELKLRAETARQQDSLIQVLLKNILEKKQ